MNGPRPCDTHWLIRLGTPKSSFIQSCLCEIVWATVFPSGAFRVAKMHGTCIGSRNHIALQWVMFQISTKSRVKHTLIYSIYAWEFLVIASLHKHKSWTQGQFHLQWHFSTRALGLDARLPLTVQVKTRGCCHLGGCRLYHFHLLVQWICPAKRFQRYAMVCLRIKKDR